jgi:nitrite reductase (NADH) small subunit
MIVVGSTDEVPQGAAREFEVSGRHITIFAIQGSYYAVDSHCPHQGGPLAQGLIEGHTIMCPWHGWSFDLRSGQRLNGPAGRLGCYRVIARDGQLMIDIP